MNRGNDRRCIFTEAADYEAFLRLMMQGRQRFPVRLFGVCIMPNHFHAVIQPDHDRALSAYFHWVLGRYACDLRRRTNTIGHGHVFQRRFWSAVIEDATHFLAVLRYVEANPCRAKLVDRAESWPWSSLTLRTTIQLCDPPPVDLPRDWAELVNGAQAAAEIESVRPSVPRGRPRKGVSSDCEPRR